MEHLQQQVSLTPNYKYYLHISKARSRDEFKDCLIQQLSDALKDPNYFHLLVVLSLGLTLSSVWYRSSECHIKMTQCQKEEKDCLFRGFLRNKDNFPRRLPHILLAQTGSHAHFQTTIWRRGRGDHELQLYLLIRNKLLQISVA